MVTNIHFIALRLTRYSDRQNILTVYSRELGRLSLSVPAGGGREANRVRALVSPLSLVECAIDHRPGRDIFPIRSPHTYLPLPGIVSSPAKQMTAMFLAEVITVVLGQTEKDEAMFDFIASSIQMLDQAQGTAAANFQLCFLVNLTRFLGIEPDQSQYHPGWVLDIRDACWRGAPPLHADYFAGREALGARRVMQMTYENMGAFHYTRQERATLLDGILNYYSWHYVPLKGLKSLTVLRTVAGV